MTEFESPFQFFVNGWWDGLMFSLIFHFLWFATGVGRWKKWWGG